MLRIRTVSNADGLHGAYDPSTALTVRNSAEVLGMTELSSRCRVAKLKELTVDKFSFVRGLSVVLVV